MNQQNNNNENWGVGLMILAFLVLACGGMQIGWLGGISTIALVIGFFRWLWFESNF